MGYSHGGNVSKHAINALSRRYRFPARNITFVNIAKPQEIDAMLNMNIVLNAQLTVEAPIDLIRILGSLPIPRTARFERFRPFPTETITVRSHIPSGLNNFFGIPAHSAMHSNVDVWRYWIIPELVNFVNGVSGLEGCE